MMPVVKVPSARFSRRSAHRTTPNALSQEVARARTRGVSLLDLTVSNPTRAGIPYAEREILAALADARALRYDPEPLGLASAREAIARDFETHGLFVSPGRLLLTASTSEAYSFLFKLLCDPGDEVLVPQPSYPLFDLIAQGECVRLVPYRLSYDGQWHVDGDSLHRAVSSRSRAVIVVSPNNPTGSYIKRSELPLFAKLDLPIVSDEVFSRYALRDDPDRALGLFDIDGPLVFALGGLSKLAGLPQLKVAWTALSGPPALVDEAMVRLELIADCFLSVATPVQLALPTLLGCRKTAESAIVARVRANLARLRAELGTHAAATLRDVEGGWYATLQLPRIESEEAWVIGFVREDEVLVHPGHFFDFSDEAFVILSLLTVPEVFSEGVGRLLARVRAAIR